MNSVCLIGRLTADPNVRAGEKHGSASFRLAVSRSGSDTPDFIDVVTFDALAGVCGDYLAKGRQVSVTGRLRHNEWTTAEGEKRSRVQVVADTVDFIDRPKGDLKENGTTADEADANDAPPVRRYRRPAGSR